MPAKVISIFSTKGGTGKTILATSLATSFTADLNKKTLLIDLDLNAPGDAARLLGLDPPKTIFDLIPYFNKNETPNLAQFILRHSSGIDFLAAVSGPRQAMHFDAKIISKIFDLISQKYDYIVVDAGRGFSETLISAFSNSNLILLVATPDVLSVYQTKWALDTLQSLQFPLMMVRLVLNRAESLGAVSWQEVKAALPSDIICRVPSDGKAVGASVNRRIPLVIDNPRSKASIAIKDLAKELISNQSLFVKIADIKATSKDGMPREGEFWQKQGMLEVLRELKPTLERDEVIELKQRIHQKLIEKLDLKHQGLDHSDEAKAKELREKTEQIVANSLMEETGVFLNSQEVRKKLVKEIVDEALGYGPLEDLLADPEVTDIMVNGKDQIYVEKRGKLELTTKRFISNEQVRQVIERIVSPLGRRIDESVPMVDARLPDGSRVNALIPPLSLVGPTLTIRKFGVERLNIDDLIKFKTLNEAIKSFLNVCVLSRKNIIVSGGTGSGKTTVLNVLSAYIPENERIVTLEDAAELRLKQEHWVRLESRPPNIEGKGAITIRELFRNTLRMRPDRVIIGECRGAETLDMLQAMNTGHDGSMTTIHANSTFDVLSRLDSMILMSGSELPVRAIREMIASAIHLIVHTARLSDGSRKVTQISEITGMLDETHVGIKDIFIFKQTGVDKEGKVLGEFQPTGYIPTFLEEIKVRGIPISEDIFKKL